ncbi:MAG: hypothetical protein IJX93_08335 [Clostridia bacterium]|nr:hypothetical protein [Clostridia bacterium]
MLKITHSIVLDTLCMLETRCSIREDRSYLDGFLELHGEIAEKFGTLLPNWCYGMSAFSYLLSVWAAETGESTETMSLSRLADVIEDVPTFDSVVRPAIDNEFLRSFFWPFLDSFRQPKHAEYVSTIRALADAGFEDWYCRRVMPYVTAFEEKLRAHYADDDTDTVLRHVARMKNREPEDITITVSMFSDPVSFTLRGGFLNCMVIDRGRRPSWLIAHECMHGFASAETTELYRKYVDADDERREMHRILIEEMHSGDEEEMVMAAEHYIMVLTGADPEAEMETARGRYGGCCPNVAVFLGLLLKEPHPVADYDAWMKKTLTNLLN